MPLLQVRDFPENYYHKLNELSERENRSITQQTIYMLKTMLDSYDLNLNTKRKAALSSIHNLSLKISSDGTINGTIVFNLIKVYVSTLAKI